MTRNAITQYKTVCLHVIIARATSLPGRDFSYFAGRSFSFSLRLHARSLDALIDFGCFIISNCVARNRWGRGGRISRAKLHWDRRLVVRVVNHFVVIGVGKLCNTITFVFLFHLAPSPLLRIRGGGTLVRIKFQSLFFDLIIIIRTVRVSFIGKKFFSWNGTWMLIYLSFPFSFVVELGVKSRYIRSNVIIICF